MAVRSTPRSKRGGSEDDDDVDIEAALLEGGGGFQPLAGLLRATPEPARRVCTAVPAIRAAEVVDRVSVSLYRRPKARLLLVLYALVAHVLILLFYVF